MPLNQLDIDDAVSKGSAQADQWMTEINKEFTKPYDQAKAQGLWFAYLEKSFPGVPGSMIEQKMREANKAQYDATKKRFIDALGGKNGTG
jgi:hypothetical protein